jgi:hypothetical protein
MDLLDEIRQVAQSIRADLQEAGGIYALQAVIAERKSFLSSRSGGR